VTSCSSFVYSTLKAARNVSAFSIQLSWRKRKEEKKERERKTESCLVSFSPTTSCQQFEEDERLLANNLRRTNGFVPTI
jgi:hypothetical protein